MELLDQLNPQQREAVETIRGPLLILAGAGSGKTRVITYRIVHLMENCGVSPDSILAVTFTNKAAQQMADRVEALAGSRSLAKPLISTFHSFCLRVLRRDIERLNLPGLPAYSRSFTVYDESDQLQLVKRSLKQLQLDDKTLTPRSVLSRISWAKNQMMDAQDVFLNSRSPDGEKVAQVFALYQKELRKSNALDFDDLLLESLRLMKSFSEVREHYNHRFRHILIDEYQDTNRPQYELMLQLAGAGHNICVVGDEDQSIYSWRGAEIRNILEFESDFPETKVIRLEQNYRSTKAILQAASSVVSNNIHRKGKVLWTERDEDSRIGFYRAPDGDSEAMFVADAIRRYVRAEQGEGREPSVAILYRTNSQSRLFEEALRRYQFDYQVIGGFSFYERAEVKDMLSYLRLIHNLDDSTALLRIINNPPRGVGDSTLELLERLALETGTSVWRVLLDAVKNKLAPARALSALRNFAEIILDARAMLEGKLVARLQGSAVAERQPYFAEPSPADDGDDTSFDFSPFAPDGAPEGVEDESTEVAQAAVPGFPAPGDPASISQLLKFIIDRTGYIKRLEAEETPEAMARIENLQELANAAQEAREREETLGEFLDHAALVNANDQFQSAVQISLMTLHAAKGLEFPLVFLVGMEEGLLPHSRTFNFPDQLEEERRLCYVGMTRAMNRLILTTAAYRRRYGGDMPVSSIPSRFLEEVPPHLLEDMGDTGNASGQRSAFLQSPALVSPGNAADFGKTHYQYENEDQSAMGSPAYQRRQAGGRPLAAPGAKKAGGINSMDAIADFFASRGKKFKRPKVPVPEPTGKTGWRPGQEVRHPKYGRGTVYKREGEGETAKITVQFPGVGLKKLMEKYAQLEKC